MSSVAGFILHGKLNIDLALSFNSPNFQTNCCLQIPRQKINKSSTVQYWSCDNG